MRTINCSFFLVALGIYFLSVAVYALRLKIVLRNIGIELGLLDAIAAHLLTVAVNNLTPSAKTGGEVARAAYVYAKTRASLANIATAIAFERLSEAIPVAVLAVTALYAAFISHSVSFYVVSAAALPIVGIVLGVRYWDRLIDYALRKSEELGFIVVDEGEELASLREMVRNPWLLGVTVTLSSIVWVLDVVRLYVIGLAVGWRAPLFRFVLLSILYLVIGLFAITPGGLGIVEGGFAAVLIALGAPADKAIAITIVERLISYAMATLVGGIVATLTGGWQAWRLLRSRWRRTGSIRK